MKIEDGKFYFISDDYFEIFSNYSLMTNKENGNKRPCYLCFKDEKTPNIIWFVPISHKVEKYKKIHKKKLEKRKKVLNFVFGNVLGREKVFLIQNMIPVTEKYIISKYQTKGIDVEIKYALKQKVIKTAKEVLNLTEKYDYNNILFSDIKKMKELLLNENIKVK